MDTSQYMPMFLEESMDNLQTISESLLELEKSPENVKILNQIFRDAHTIKGMAASMGFIDIAEVTHKMEDVLSECRDGKMKVTRGVVTVFFDCLDTLEKMIDIVREDSEEIIEIDGIIKRLDEIKNTVDFKKEEIMKLVKSISEVEEVHVKSLDFQNEEEKKEIEIIEEKPKKEEEKRGSSKKLHQSVRVDLEKVDNLMNMVSELVIYRTRLEQIGMANQESELNEILDQVGRTTSELQELVMKIRMLPLEVVFNRFPRMIRDVSLELKKEVEFIIEGANTELDRIVIDEIGEPLIHLLRNAIDHGIESKEERLKRGKGEIGKIKIQAYQEGTKAVIKVTDDGAGINVEKIRRKAENIGISTDGMSEQDIKNLIFTQGFSTNEVVTDISGRGVGMDVVKTKIASLGGSLECTSKEGIGSTFVIRLPLTLQIIQALLINIGDETCAISLGFIDRVISYNEEDIKKINGKEVIVYGDKVIPLVRLDEKLNIEGKKGNEKFIIIVNAGERTFGLLVDSLMGQQEIVIKPLGKILKGLNEYIGATILGNGLVILILDVGALY